MSQTYTRPMGDEIELGQALAKRRATLGLSRDQLSTALLLSTRQIDGIEAGDASAFYNRTFYLKALRKYAAYMQVPMVEDPAGEETTHPQPAVQPQSAPEASLSGDAPRHALSALVPVLAVLAVAATAGTAYVLGLPGQFRAMSQAQQSEPLPLPVAPPAPPPSVADSGVPSPALVADPAEPTAPLVPDATPAVEVAGPQGQVGHLRVGMPTWVFVRYPDNRVVQRSLGSGESLELEERPVYLAVGVPQVALTVGGRTIDTAPFVNADREVRLGARELEGLPFPDVPAEATAPPAKLP